MSARACLFGLVVLSALALTDAKAASWSGRPQQPALENGEFTAELNGLKLWYKISGSGPVCLMPSPAWGPSSDMYFRTLKPLEKTFTVVYVDTRGTGRSQRAKSAKDYTWDHLVADLDALRAYLKQEKVWLMGHSEGGVQVLHYACKHPERVGGLVLLSTAAAIRPIDILGALARARKRKGNEPWFAELLKARQKSPKTDEEFAAMVKKGMPVYWSDPSRIEKHKEHFEATSFSVEADRGALESKRAPLNFDLTKQLTRVTAPALIVGGTDDLLNPVAWFARLHLSLPNSKLLLIEDCGHFPWLEQEDVFSTQVSRFLEAIAPGLIKR